MAKGRTGMRQLIRLLGIGMCVLLASLAVGARAEDQISADCAVCHEEIVAHFETTVHSIAGRGVPSCATCHTNGQMHMEEGGDPDWTEVPAGADGEQRKGPHGHQQSHVGPGARAVAEPAEAEEGDGRERGQHRPERGCSQ